MSLFQSMVLAINTSILAVLFAFSAWLYASSRAEVLEQVEASLGRTVTMTEALAGLKAKELDALAQSMAVSPMLRAAVATGDAATIRDVLATLAKKNGVLAVELKAGGKLRHGSGAAATAAFSGAAPAGEAELSVRQAADRALLDSWSAVTGVRYVLKSGPVTIHNLPAADEKLAAAAAPSAEAGPVDGETGRYYARSAALAGGRFIAVIFAERPPFWRSFEDRRNSLIVLGAALFFAGLLLSAAFARLIEKAAAGRPAADDARFQGLLDEIEAARPKAGPKAGPKAP